MSFNDAIEVVFDCKALNYLIGITNNNNVNSDNYYDNVHNKLLVDNININVNQFKFEVDGPASVKNVGILSTLYSDLSNLISQNFYIDSTSSNGIATLIGINHLNTNGGIFDSHQLIDLFQKNLSGNVQLNNITDMLTYAINNNPFGNRNSSSSILDGFHAGDLIFFPNGFNITLNIPFNFSKADIRNNKILQSISSSQINKVITAPLLVRLTNFQDIILIDSKILETSFETSNFSVGFNSTSDTVQSYKNSQILLKQAFTSQLASIANNLVQATKTFNFVNASTYIYNTLGLFQTALQVFRFSESQFYVDNKLDSMNLSYSSTLSILVLLSQLSLDLTNTLDLLAHDLVLYNSIANSSSDSKTQSDAQANLQSTAQQFIDLQTNSSIDIATKNAVFILESNVILNNVLFKDRNFINLDTDFYNIRSILNSLNAPNPLTASIFANPVSPGVYATGAALAVTGNVILDGQSNSNSIFVFRVAGALSFAASVNINLINGAVASNVFWVSVGAYSVGATTNFTGTVLCDAAIAIGAGCNVYGRLFGVGAISFNNSNIYLPLTPSYFDLGNLTLFSLYSQSTISNVDGGLCIVTGSITSRTGVNFLTPGTSPVVLVGNIYSKPNTGATVSTQGPIYTNNHVNIIHGTTQIPITLNNTYTGGFFALINEPKGLQIDPMSGNIKIVNNILIGVYLFYILFYKNNFSVVSPFVLTIIPYITVSDITNSVQAVENFQNAAVVTAQTLFNTISTLKIQTDLSSTPSINPILKQTLFNSLQISNSTSGLFIQDAITKLGNLLQRNNDITFSKLDDEFSNIRGYFGSLNAPNPLTATIFANPVTPGVYATGGALAITGNITLDGQSNSNSTFVFRVGGALSFAANVNFILINGALSSNVFWVSVGAASLGANANFYGTLLCDAATAIGAGCKIYGRILAIGAISINHNNIFLPLTPSNFNLIHLSLFALYSRGTISNVDGGPCIVMGNIGSGSSLTVATPNTSPLILIGNIYAPSSDNTGANLSTIRSVYSNNNIQIDYQTIDFSITPNNTYINGLFTLINQPLGLQIDPLSGVMTITSFISIGIKQFYISYFNNGVSIVSVFILTVV